MWCVDISTDIPKATCVKVLGMMRERTISNNPDPLKVITIYSSNRTHYFRAFDVKEQEKWMADLTANTIFAADNEVINIADVIACDEEKSRVNRMHAVIKQLFETPLVSEKLLEVANADECYQPITISQGNKINGDNIANRSDDELSGSLNPQLSALMLANKNGSSRTSLGRDLISAQNSKSLSCQLPKYGMLAPEDLYLLDVTNSSLSPSKMSLMTKFHFPATSERNTSSVTDLLHSIHINDSTLTEMITFVADVQRYKELFRFRSVSSYKKKQAAFIIYINYIIPQLKLADLDSGRQRTFTNNSNFSTSMRFNDNELNSNARERFLSVGNRDETGPFNGDKVRFKYYRKYIASNRRINNKLNSMKSSLLADQDSSMNDRKVDVWLGISKDSLMKIFRSLLDEEDDTIDCTRKDSDSSIGNFSSATNSKETSSGKIGGSSAKLENSSNVKTTEFPSETIRPALKLSNVDSDEEVVGMRDVVTPINGNGTSSDIEQSNSVKIGVIRNDINDMITANQITPENKGSFSFRPRLLSGASLTGDPRAPIDTNSSANVDSKEPASSTSSGFWFLGGNRNASVKSKAESNNPKAADSQLARMASWNDEDSINTENIVNDMKEPSPFLFDEAVSDIMKVCNDSV